MTVIACQSKKPCNQYSLSLPSPATWCNWKLCVFWVSVNFLYKFASDMASYTVLELQDVQVLHTKTFWQIFRVLTLQFNKMNIVHKYIWWRLEFLYVSWKKGFIHVELLTFKWKTHYNKKIFCSIFSWWWTHRAFLSLNGFEDWHSDSLLCSNFASTSRQI